MTNDPEEAEFWYVYLLECCDLSLYTGIARDPLKRLQQHNSGKGAKYTRSRLPVRLLYQEACPDKSSALQREFAIKQLSRADKLLLISSAGNNPGRQNQ
ncbi:MAG: GIY-YIG nuclease family protein [Chromatiales bacterium]|jgi:pyrroline-5-carboxylate reductase